MISDPGMGTEYGQIAGRKTGRAARGPSPDNRLTVVKIKFTGGQEFVTVVGTAGWVTAGKHLDA